MHHLGLPDAMHARHRLQVDLRVPVGVEEDARVGGLAVDAEAARARRHEEAEPAAAHHVEGVDVDRALHAVCGAVEAAVLVLAVVEEVFEQVQRRGELREEDDAVAGAVELVEEPVEQLELARAVDELLGVGVLAVGLDAGEEERVVAALA